MSAIVSFGSCNVMLMGGGLAPFAGEGGSAWSSTGWLGGRPLCVWFFSNVGGCGVVFFGGAAGGCLSGRYSFCLWLLVTCPGEWAVWLPFPLIRRFFFFNVFDNGFMRLRCAGVLGLEGFESVF